MIETWPQLEAEWSGVQSSCGGGSSGKGQRVGTLDASGERDGGCGRRRTSSPLFTSARPASVARKSSTRSVLPAGEGFESEGEGERRGAGGGDLGTRRTDATVREDAHPPRPRCEEACARPRRGAF